ncbi:MAG: immunoglobulin domain-containing protein [Chitinivibrionales bacterium]|nr:immunoglobulin domain-containing protein [Chitinivibrionales bacterium]
MKKLSIIITISSILCVFIAMYCVDPSIPGPNSVNPEDAAITISVQKKPNETTFKIDQLVTLNVLIKYPKFFDSIIVNFGEPNNPNNIQVDTLIPTTMVSIPKSYSITYKSPGVKRISVCATLENSPVERLATDSLVVGSVPIIVDKLIRCWPAQPSFDKPCSLYVIVKSFENIPNHFLWLKDGVVIKDQSKSSIFFEKLQNDHNGAYCCYVANEFGADTSAVLRFDIQQVTFPVIVLQPQSQAVTVGKTVSFVCKALPTTVAYQWLKNSTPIDNEIRETLNVPNVTLADHNGKYSCIVQNNKGSIRSNEALLLVYETEQPISITQQPRNDTVSVGQMAEFSVEALGTNMSYQWYKNDQAVASGIMAHLSIDPVVIGDNQARFYCTITNPLGKVSSSVALLSVKDTTDTTPFEIKRQPADCEVSENSEALFEVEAVGKQLTYQWKRDNTLIPQAVAAKYVLKPAVASDNGALFSCVVTSGTKSLESRQALLKVVKIIQPPKITAEPRDTEVVEGSQAQFTIVASGANLKYQWKKNDADVPNNTEATLILKSVTIADSNGRIKCIVSNSADTIESKTVILRVKKAIVPPTITTQPVDVTVTEGADAKFEVTATGTDLHYQWKMNGTDITGATQSKVSIKVALTDNGAKIKCVIGNNADTIESREALLTVSKAVIPPQINTHPSDQKVIEGNEAGFQVVATGTDLKYQWKKGGVDIPGATQSTYKFKTTLADNGTSFACVVFNSADTVESNSAKLSVDKLIVPPTISAQPQNATVKKGESATFTITASGTDIQYQWYKNGTEVSGATTNTLTIPNTTEQDNNATIKCSVKNSVGSVESNGVKLTVQWPPEITGQPSDQTLDMNATVTWKVDVKPGNPAQVTYKWMKDGKQIVTTQTLTLNPVEVSDAGTYTCEVSNGAGSSISKPWTLTVHEIVKPEITKDIDQSKKYEILEGGQFTMAITARGEKLSYQWYLGNRPLSGQTQPSVTVTVDSIDDKKSVYCKVSNPAGSINSSTVPIYVYWARAIRPADIVLKISESPDSITMEVKVVENFPNPTILGAFKFGNNPVGPTGAKNFLKLTGLKPADNSGMYSWTGHVYDWSNVSMSSPDMTVTWRLTVTP